MPSKEITQKYLKKILFETDGYEQIYATGAIIYKIKVYHVYFDTSNETIIYFYRNAVTEGKCSYGYSYENISWKKMTSIEDWDKSSNNSPVKFLKINFVSNSVLRTGYTDYDCTDIAEFSSLIFGKQMSVDYILFPYRNEEGIKERLTIAISHLVELEKKEAKANDPFGN